ncbi:alpha/beta hydrolase [Jannaschia rubra]|uniref:Palmitoyl-protein thioesterase ABHD10, mitochondrial n=1 Tax=Jannaschia rubra TaxID=282197 RepID=A0A0M6XVQ7_9RHOB|nr:alpha/beta hydrolase [Jannaschia rubra]CTQ34024.1 acetoin dehydrogenase E2 subunit dihydrolipoyllysine-residue acetyltransferase [Jannaschia rubra]SFG24922.1 Pimeloyl-ACP methyl ester carboxylesterase [Jannaschia rubra]
MAQTITRNGNALAYRATPGAGPGVVFLGGFKSDMQGTKALALEDWARAQGRAFLRLDYSGHGESGGTFEEGGIGDWFRDAMAVIESATTGPQVIVGSSMGGWISLLVARTHPERVAGLVTIAAAPDFTEDGYWAAFDPDQRATVMDKGRISVPSDYGDPYVITRRLIEDGRDHLVLRTPLRLHVPVRMLQGTADEAVPVATALRLLDHMEGDDIRLTLVKDADHRFSTGPDLALIQRSVEEVIAAI